MTYYCQEVLIKYRTNHQGQRITKESGPTAAHALRVHIDSDFLTIQFVDSEGKTRKMITTPTPVIQEFELVNVCEKPAEVPQGFGDLTRRGPGTP